MSRIEHPSRHLKSATTSSAYFLLLTHHATGTCAPCSASRTSVNAPRRESEILENSRGTLGPSKRQSPCHLSNSAPPSHKREPQPRIAKPLMRPTCYHI